MAVYMFLGAFEYKCVATENGGHEHLEFQVCEVLTHACPIIHAEHKISFSTNGTSALLFHRPWTVREWVERLPNPSLILFEPPFGPKHVDIVSPNLRIPVNSIAGYA